MNVKTLALTGTALAILVILGVLSNTSPAFKATATTASIVILAVIALGAPALALAVSLVPTNRHKPAQRPFRARGTAHTGNTR